MAEANAGMKRGRRRRAIVLFALLLVAGGGYGAWRWHAGGVQDAATAARSTQPSPRVPVTAAAVRQENFPLYLYGLGTVTPPNSVTISSRVTGVVTRVPVEDGQMVRQGDLLAEIDSRPYQALLDQATAKLAQDQATLENAQVVLKRLSTLLQKTFETQQNVDNQQALVNSTLAEIEGDKAAIEAAQLNLDFTKITAPLAGKTSFRAIDPGNIVQANQSAGLFTIVQLQPIEVQFTEPQEDVAKINKVFAAGPATVDALALDGKTVIATGTLAAIDNKVDQASGTISLKATFANADNALWPGLSVSTRTRVGTLDKVVLAPDEAIQHAPDGLFVYVVGDDGRAHRRVVEAGPSDGGNTVVSDGLTSGEHVVVTGQYRLVDGATVDATATSTEQIQPAARETKDAG